MRPIVLTGLFGVALGYERYKHDQGMMNEELRHMRQDQEVKDQHVRELQAVKDQYVREVQAVKDQHGREFRQQQQKYEAEIRRLERENSDLKLEARVKQDLEAWKRKYEAKMAERSPEGPLQRFLKALGMAKSPEEAEYVVMTFDPSKPEGPVAAPEGKAPTAKSSPERRN